MGQEIAYCALCGCQLRSADFQKAGAFRVDIKSYCKKCAPEAVKSLSPDKIQEILKQGAIPKESSPKASGQPISTRAMRVPEEVGKPRQTMIFAMAATALALGVIIVL